MMIVSSLLGSAAASLTLPGTLELMMLTAGGVLPAPKRKAAIRSLKKLVVIIPAHDEKQSIAETVQNLMAVDRPDAEYEVIVVADNCTDDTAELAREAGASDVWERHDDVNRGKGFALDFAFGKLLEDKAMDAVLIVDADTVVDRNFARACEASFAAGADAVQCRYLVRNPSESQRATLMNTALMAFNVLRPRGRARFGLSAGILGNGWGLSRDCLETLPYNAYSVVEDLEYHIRLVRAGKRVDFLDDTTVYGEMPGESDAASTQRERWEGGRFRMIREKVPELLSEALKGNLRVLEPAGELMLLPLAYHVGGLVVTLLIPFPLTQLYALGGLSVVAMHVLSGLAVGGGGANELKALLDAPRYVLWKAGILKKILDASQKDQAWVRTGRTDESE